eukprot:1883961-Amphidinium_carterae.2
MAKATLLLQIKISNNDWSDSDTGFMCSSCHALMSLDKSVNNKHTPISQTSLNSESLALSYTLHRCLYNRGKDDGLSHGPQTDQSSKTQSWLKNDHSTSRECEDRPNKIASSSHSKSLECRQNRQHNCVDVEMVNDVFWNSTSAVCIHERSVTLLDISVCKRDMYHEGQRAAWLLQNAQQSSGAMSDLQGKFMANCCEGPTTEKTKHV